jgi:hypothetical protein
VVVDELRDLCEEYAGEMGDIGLTAALVANRQAKATLLQNQPMAFFGTLVNDVCVKRLDACKAGSTPEEFGIKNLAPMYAEQATPWMMPE